MRASRNPKIVELLTDLSGGLRFDTGKLNMNRPAMAHQLNGTRIGVYPI